MTLTKAIKAKDNLDFISDLFFKFIWVVMPLMFWPNLPYPIEFVKVTLFIGIVGIYFGYLRPIVHESYRFSKYWILIPLILLVVSEMVSSLNGTRIAISLFGIQYRYQGLVTQIGYILFILTVSNSKNGTNNIKYGAIILSLLTIIEAFNDNGLRAVGLLGNSNFTGGYLALCLPFHGNIYFIIISSIAIYLTGSRSAILAAIIVGLLYVIFKYKSKLLNTILVITTFVAIMLWLPGREGSRFDTRYTIWAKAIEAGMQKPVNGWGLENFELAFNSTLKEKEFDLKNIRVDKAHNEFLEVFVNSGFVGLFFYTTLIIFTFYKIRRKPKYLLALVMFIIVSNLNVVNINEYLVFYLIVGESTKNGFPPSRE